MNSVNRRSIVVLALLTVGLSACDKFSSPTNPSPPTPSSVMLTITDRVTGQPVAGAEVNTTSPVSSSMTGGDGRVSVNSISSGTRFEISAPGYLTRKVPYSGDTNINLAPVGPLGKEFVYMAGFNAIRSDNRMIRINSDLWLALDSRIANDPEAVQVFREAAAEISEANGRFMVRLALDSTPSVGALTADVYLGNETGAGPSVSVSPSAGSDGVIIKYVAFYAQGLSSARSKPAVLAGLGVAIGLRQPSSSDPKFPSFLWKQGFITDADRQLLRLHVWTESGTYWEDTSPKWYN